MIKIRSVILDFGGVISQPQNKNIVKKAYVIMKQKPPDLMESMKSIERIMITGEIRERNTGPILYDNMDTH